MHVVRLRAAEFHVRVHASIPRFRQRGERDDELRLDNEEFSLYLKRTADGWTQQSVTSKTAVPLAPGTAAATTPAAAPVAPKPMQPPPPSTYRSDDMDDTVQRVPRGMKVV